MADISFNNVPVLSQLSVKDKTYYLKDAEGRAQLQAEANARAEAIVKVLEDSKAYTDEQIGEIEHIKYKLVTELPTADADHEFNKSLTVYLINERTKEKDVYCEYICVKKDDTYSWEKIGDSTVDLSNYYTKSEIDGKVTTLENTIKTEETRAKGIESDLDTRIKKLEAAEVPLATDSKVGGIKIGHEASKGEAAVKLDTDGKAYVEATLYSAKTDGGLQLEDTEFSIKEVSTDLIKNGSSILIINGGSAAE